VDISQSSAVERVLRMAELHGMNMSGIELPEDRDVVIERHRFHYLRSGDEAAPALVFLHGATLTAHTWDLVMMSLSNDYQCLAPDLRGHGDSEWSPGLDYSLETHADDIDGFIDRLGLEHVVLVGHSMGGLVAMLCAAQRPERLSGIVIVDIGPEINHDRAREIRQSNRRRVEFDTVEEFVEMATQAKPKSDPELVRSNLLPNLRKLPNGKLTWKYDLRQWELDGRIDEVVEALSAAVPRVQCPALVIRGERSRILPARAAERLASRLAEARCEEVSGAGHIVQGDNPKQLSEKIRAFLAEIAF
jgi:esterase